MTENVIGVMSLEGNQIGRSVALVIIVVVVLFHRQRMIRGTEWHERLFILANDRSTKQWVEPESTNTGNEGIAWSMIVTDGRRELGSERAAALSRASIGAQSGTMQLPLCAESQELLSIFLPQWRPSV